MIRHSGSFIIELFFLQSYIYTFAQNVHTNWALLVTPEATALIDGYDSTAHACGSGRESESEDDR